MLESNELSTTKSESGSGPTRSRSGKVVQPPSWRRSLKRGGIFAPIMFAMLIILLMIGYPDGILYRSHLKRSAQRDRSDGRRGS